MIYLAVVNFYFDLVPSFYFLKWKHCFSAYENLLNSSCHFWKCKLVFVQILYQSSVLSNIILLYFFSSNIIYFGQKGLIKEQIFENFEYLGRNSSNFACHFWNNKSIPFQLCIILHCHDNLHKVLSSVLWKIAPLYFAQKELIKNIFKNFECSDQNLSNSTYQFCNNKSVPLQILHQSSVAWKINPLHFFSSNNKYFAQKDPIKGKIFETSGCLGQNLSNSPAQFCNSKSLPLQIPNFFITLQCYEK